jgi:rhamnulokinase
MTSDGPAGEWKDARRALVAIDLGAESCRVSLLRWHGDDARIQLVHRFPNHAVEQDGSLRWQMQKILDGLMQGLRQCAEIAQEGIASIAVDGWAVDYVRLNDSGRRMGDPFCYRDERTVAAEAGLHKRISAERMREITGVQLLRINTVYQMFADAPELRRMPWLNLPEYMLYWLGGTRVSELTNATHTQMVGLDAQWSNEILAALGCSFEDMPPIVPAGTDLGPLRGELAKLRAFVGTRLIAPACHDTASAIAAIPDAGDDWAYISAGTWSLVGTPLDSPVNTKGAQAGNFTNLRGAGGNICFHKNVNGMWLLRQCMEFWAEQGFTHDVASLVEVAGGVAAPAELLDVDDPDLLLPGDMPHRINAQRRRAGCTELSTHPRDAHEVAALLFHSLAARYAEVLRNVQEITGKRFSKVYVMGGASRNELLNRLTSEATGLPVYKAGVEASTVGNFAVQMAGLESVDGAAPGRKEIAHWATRFADAIQA